MNYSTNNTIYSSLINLSFEEFAHWFSGFCDAESFFFILDSGNSFYFKLLNSGKPLKFPNAMLSQASGNKEV